MRKKRWKKKGSGYRRNSCAVLRAERKNQIWTWDFIHGRTEGGRPLRRFAPTDEYTRECPALDVERSFMADRPVAVLVALFAGRGAPRGIRSDNGQEFVAEIVGRICRRAGCEVLYPSGERV